VFLAPSTEWIIIATGHYTGLERLSAIPTITFPIIDHNFISGLSRIGPHAEEVIFLNAIEGDDVPLIIDLDSPAR
jgi:hypothetical protein